jgi:hypothetical protein
MHIILERKVFENWLLRRKKMENYIKIDRLRRYEMIPSGCPDFALTLMVIQAVVYMKLHLIL